MLVITILTPSTKSDEIQIINIAKLIVKAHARTRNPGNASFFTKTG